jgi:predicted RNase H-like HicB family nuclease
MVLMIGTTPATLTARLPRDRDLPPPCDPAGLGEDGSYSAYVPDLPGCTAAGESIAEVEKLIREAIDFHIERLREHGDPVPPPTAVGATIVEAPSGQLVSQAVA